MSTQPPSPPRRSRLLTLGLWAGLGLALIAAFWLALGACGLAGPGGRPWLAFCPDPVVEADRRAALEAALARERLLEAHLDRLRLALAAAPHCPAGERRQPPPREAGPSRPSIPVPGEPGEIEGPPVEVAEGPDEDGPESGREADAAPEAPLPEPPPVPEDADRQEPQGPSPETPEPPLPAETPDSLDEQDAAPDTGEAPPPPPERPEPTDAPLTPPEVPEPPLPDDRPETPPEEGPDTDRDTGPARTPPEPPEEPDLPEAVLEEGDIAQLQGCWSLVSPYSIRSRDTGEAYGTQDWQMCFGPDGTGTQTLTFENGLVCEGRVHAQFDETGNLEIIDLGNVPCEGGRGIDQRITRCERQDGSVDCTTRHTTPPEFPVPVRFEREAP